MDHARLLAAFDQHSADWLHALPLSSCGLFLDNEAIRIAVALRLGATMCLPHDCQCGQTIDALGLHCFSCLKNSGKHTRHSILNDIVWRTMTRAKIQSIKEPLSSYRMMVLHHPNDLDLDLDLGLDLDLHLVLDFRHEDHWSNDIHLYDSTSSQ